MRIVSKHQVKLIIILKQILIRMIGTVFTRYSEERINKGIIDYCSKILMAVLDRIRRIKEVSSIITLMEIMMRRVYPSKNEKVSVGSYFLSMNRMLSCRTLSMMMMI